ncbi:alcohol dehydrogenase [Capronia epimyces CBS 606.96]|uniref:Alcohol dehydrogenase n=1 Tax=Capronia epimyces CBS 606.96 TaxID=1182542 RepID=W9XTZ6_9EURO|nr:alcohol dehydrogenase [Capronia epimyces CBS 606.96]EXJ80810.1 alcohol dehydrogenase [Capronia epimyces CBS 606.96]
MFRPVAPLSATLPPLVFGTATFNYQYNVDPYALSTTSLVQKALAQGVRAFDTSPYYGPAEEILGSALDSDIVRNHYPRDQYFILTKVGRVASDSFDYSPAWVRKSVQRSCNRLKTDYLDVVYCHDCEFVSPREVLGAVRELRRIRDEEGTLRYVGISGYPVHVLCELAEMILQETGEPIDIVQSYANFTLQNTRLLSEGLQRLVTAGADVVTNASPLGMGLLRRNGPPRGGMGNWHPAPDDLRQACIDAGEWANSQGEKLEVVAVRFALENWLREGAKAGAWGSPLGDDDTTYGRALNLPREKLGVTVMGVSNMEELEETLRVWRSVLDGFADDLDAEPGTITPSDAVTDHEWSLLRRQTIRVLAKGIREVIGPQWVDYVWPSPDPGFVNQLQASNVVDEPRIVEPAVVPEAGILTPPLDAGDDGKSADMSDVVLRFDRQG